MKGTYGKKEIYTNNNDNYIDENDQEKTMDRFKKKQIII